MKILICGLPGSGKTTFAKELAYHFKVPHHNGGAYRDLYHDWDFSHWGRINQAIRMSRQWGILDFICPTQTTRSLVDASFIIWMDTINGSDYPDTNKVWEEVDGYNLRLTKFINVDELKDTLQDYEPTVSGLVNFLYDVVEVYKY